MKPSETLAKARELLEDPSRWTRHYYARNKYGDPSSDIQRGTCWCAIGALLKVRGVNSLIEVYGLQKDVNYLDQAARCRVSVFNDDPDTTHTDILRLFDKAIELAKENGE